METKYHQTSESQRVSRTERRELVKMACNLLVFIIVVVAGRFSCERSAQDQPSALLRLCALCGLLRDYCVTAASELVQA